MNVYENCPTIENKRYLIRLIQKEDSKDLFEVYGDKFALPFFNSDNCHGSNFYCSKLEYMDETIKYWLMEYHETHGFVRFSIYDKKINKVIGTIEIFHRDANDFYNNCGLLRLDLGCRYEKTEVIYDVLSIIIHPFYEWFNCEMIATKAPVYAVDRIEALKKIGFSFSKEPLIGHDGKQYYEYWILNKKENS